MTGREPAEVGDGVAHFSPPPPENPRPPRGRKEERNREGKSRLTGPEQTEAQTSLKSHIILAGKVVQRVKALAAKPDNLSLFPLW